MRKWLTIYQIVEFHHIPGSKNPKEICIGKHYSKSKEHCTKETGGKADNFKGKCLRNKSRCSNPNMEARRK